MTRHSGLPPVWPLLPTLAVTWLVFAQALSFGGLVLWVIVPSLAQVLLVRVIARTGLVTVGYVAAAVLTPMWALAANTLGGFYSGPVARSALLASGLTLAGLVMLDSRRPVLVLVPSGLLLIGALGLGAAAASVVFTGLWMCAAILTLLMLGPYTREDLRAGARLVLVARTMLIGGLVAVVGSTVAVSFMGSPWQSTGLIPTTLLSPDDATGRTSIFDAFVDALVVGSLAVVREFFPPATPVPGPTPLWLEFTRWAIVLGLVALIALPLVRRGYAWVAWRLLRDRLRSGDARERALGAWTWARMRRAWREEALPEWASPDIVQPAAEDAGDERLATIATIAMRAAYDPITPVTDEEADAAWAAALELDTLDDEVTVAQVWRWAARRRGRVPRQQRLALMPS